MPKYDSTEALEKLGAFVEERDPDLVARAAAGRELLEELAALNVPGLTVQRRNENAVAFEFGAARALVKVNDHAGTISVGVPHGGRVFQENEVPLRYDRLARKFTGKGPASDRAPIPGNRTPFRDALSVVAEIVVAKLRLTGEA